MNFKGKKKSNYLGQILKKKKTTKTFVQHLGPAKTQTLEFNITVAASNEEVKGERFACWRAASKLKVSYQSMKAPSLVSAVSLGIKPYASGLLCFSLKL